MLVAEDGVVWENDFLQPEVNHFRPVEMQGWLTWMGDNFADWTWQYQPTQIVLHPQTWADTWQVTTATRMGEDFAATLRERVFGEMRLPTATWEHREEEEETE